MAHKRAVHAVVVETLRLAAPLSRAAHVAGLPSVQRLREAQALVLCYEVLRGSGVRPLGGAERAVLRARRALERAWEAEEASGFAPEGPAGPAGPDGQETTTLTRVVRANPLKLEPSGLPAALAAAGLGPATPDPILPGVFRVPASADLNAAHPLVASGRVVLQGRSSCLPALALAAAGMGPGDAAADATAAPGNKTTHVAGIVGAGATRGRRGSSGRRGSGVVVAFERDPRRADLLRDTVARCGADGVVDVRCADFLAAEPADDAALSRVRCLVVDPSCSGSGTREDGAEAAARGLELLPPWGGHMGTGGEAGGAADAAAPAPDATAAAAGDWPPSPPPLDRERVARLAAFQSNILAAALTRWPGADLVCYSTCSVYAEENEGVVGSAAVRDAMRSGGWTLREALPAWPRRGMVPIASSGGSRASPDVGAPDSDDRGGGRPSPHPVTAEEARRCLRARPGEDGGDGFFVALFARRGGLSFAGEGSSAVAGAAVTTGAVGDAGAGAMTAADAALVASRRAKRKRKADAQRERRRAKGGGDGDGDGDREGVDSGDGVADSG